VNISGTPFTGGASVKLSVFDIDFQTDGACTGGTITQENGAAVAAIHANGAKAIVTSTPAARRPSDPTTRSTKRSTPAATGACSAGHRRLPERVLAQHQQRHGTADVHPGEISKRLDRRRADGFDGVEMDGSTRGRTERG
jgi:hypothetical protein